MHTMAKTNIKLWMSLEKNHENQREREDVTGHPEGS